MKYYVISSSKLDGVPLKLPTQIYYLTIKFYQNCHVPLFLVMLFPPASLMACSVIEIIGLSLKTKNSYADQPSGY